MTPTAQSELGGEAGMEENRSQEMAAYAGSEKSDTCLMINSDAQHGLYLLTGLHSCKLNCTTCVHHCLPPSY